jgi:hypothetical protein
LTEMNLQEEQKHCKQVYEKWDFVKRIVELYAEGVSWKGCNLIEVDAIKDGVRSMLVTGVGDFKIRKQGGMQTISVQMPSIILIEESGHPFLWPATQNAKILEETLELLKLNPSAAEMANFLMKDMCLGLGVPYELLGPISATADADAIMWGLITFKYNIGMWRDYLGHRLGLRWNETWLLNGLVAYGQVYQVFKAQGIELKTLAQQVQSTAKSVLDSSLISRQTYDETIKWFVDR